MSAPADQKPSMEDVARWHDIEDERLIERVAREKSSVVRNAMGIVAANHRAMAAAIRRAVADEREACALLVEHWFKPSTQATKMERFVVQQERT